MEAKSLLPSPRNSHSSNSSSSSNNSSNGLQLHQLPPMTPTAPSPASPGAYPPKPVTRSESANPYPTTFVQADTSSFKQVVQMLTGSTETAKHASSNYSKPHSEPNKPHNTIPPIKKSGFKLYERRNSLKNLNINPMLPSFSSNGSGFSPRKPEVLSPSILDFPSLVLSPVTPLIPDPFDRSRFANGPKGTVSVNLDSQAEEKAIKDKGFYLHPSPGTTPRDSEPRLLPLFPTTSPRASEWCVQQEDLCSPVGRFSIFIQANHFKKYLEDLFGPTSVVLQKRPRRSPFNVLAEI